MGVLDKIFNRKNIRDAGAIATATGLMATGGGMQATNKPPVPDDTSTPPTKELKLSQSQPTLEERAKTAGLGKITITSPEKHSPNKIYIDEKTGKKYNIPNGYKVQKLPDGSVSFVPKTIRDYRDEGATILRDEYHRHKQTKKSQPKPTKEEILPQNNNTKSQPTSDTTQILNGETPLTADVSNGKSLEVGGGINWGHLGFDSPQTSPQPEKNHQQPEQNNQNDQEEKKPSNIKEERPSIPSGVTMRYTENTSPETLNLKEYFNKQNKPGANSYNNGDEKFGTPKSTPPQENKNEEYKPKNKNNENQTTPEKQPSDKPQKEQSPKPTKPPERLKVDGPTAIAFKDDNKLEKNATEQLSDSLEQITKMTEIIEPEQLGTSGVRKLLKLGTTLTTLALAALNADNTLANPTGQINLRHSTEHTLTNTKEVHNQIIRSAYFQWLKEQEEHMFDKKPLTKEKFVENYNNTHPDNKISVTELDEFARQASLNTNNTKGGKIKPHIERTKTGNSHEAFLEDLPTVQARPLQSGAIYEPNSTYPPNDYAPKQTEPYRVDEFGNHIYSTENGPVEIPSGTYNHGIIIEEK